MQYTTQQLQGGPRYSHKTRIGNWNEDMELGTIQQTDYQAKKTNGQLPFNKTQSVHETAYKKVPWTHSADGQIRSGDCLMLKNKKTNGWLAFNANDKCPGTEERYMCTTTADEGIGPANRAVFKIDRVEEQDMFGSDNIIRYGQKIRIESNPYAFRKPLVLSSTPKSQTNYSPVSRLNEATMHGKSAYPGVWIIDACDPNFRMEVQGEPVRVNEPLLLRHCSTSHYLGSDDKRYANDFGGEKEVMCHSFAILNRTQNLALENQGNITSDVPTKFQHDQNIWFICDAPNASYSVPMEELEAFSIEDLVAEVKAKILTRSSGGIKGIARIFKAMDDNGNRQLDVEDFRWGFIDYGFNLTQEEAQHLVTHFDRDGNGTVSYDEFLRALKGQLNEARKVWIKAAYDKLDVNKDGQVTLADIAQIYDASEHPEVKEGKKTPDQVFQEFMSQWDTQEADGIVTFDEFCEYYEGVSCSIDRDDYFELMMKNAWKL